MADIETTAQSQETTTVAPQHKLREGLDKFQKSLKNKEQASPALAQEVVDSVPQQRRINCHALDNGVFRCGAQWITLKKGAEIQMDEETFNYFKQLGKVS